MNLAPLHPVLASALLAGSLTFAAAQPGPAGIPGLFGPQPRVSVMGTGEIRVAPDMAVITVDATYTRATPREAAAEVRKTMDAVLALVRRSVKDTNDLRTARVSLNAEYDWSSSKRVFRGYAASQTLEITVRDLEKIETLLGDLYKTSLTGLNGPDFRHSRADSLRREASALAVRDAAANAKVLCAAAQRACDELVALRAGGAGSPPYPMPEMKAMRMAADAGGAMPVQPGLLTFAATVEADYRLK